MTDAVDRGLLIEISKLISVKYYSIQHKITKAISGDSLSI